MKFYKTFIILLTSLLFTLFAFTYVKEITNPIYAQDPIEISSLEDLNSIRDNSTADYILTRDLDFNNLEQYSTYNPIDETWEGEDLKTAWTTGQGWEPIGSFEGEFDGQGYKISNLKINNPFLDDVGLFGVVQEGAQVNNVGLINVSVKGGSSVGGLVGNLIGSVNNSYTTGVVEGGFAVGGLVGVHGPLFMHTITNSWSGAQVNGGELIGGLVGLNLGVILNSFAIGDVTGDEAIGGLVGANGGQITNSYYNYDEVLINGSKMFAPFALYGFMFDDWLDNNKEPLDIDNLLTKEGDYYLLNSVNDLKKLIIFGNDLSLKFRLNTDLDLINEPDFYIPSFSGEFDGNGHKISNIKLNYPNQDFIGFFGVVEEGAKVENIGLIGVNITGKDQVGGLVGNLLGAVNNSYTTGVVEGENQVGGLVGRHGAQPSMTITNSWSSVQVSGESNIGGLVGFNESSTITNSYSTGRVTGSGTVGGLVGNSSNSPITNSFWDTQTSGLETSSGGVGKSTLQMKSLLTFNESWDILDIYDFNSSDPSIWYIDDTNGYPQLFFEYVQPSIETQLATDVTTSSIKLNGNITTLGVLGNAKVYFQYREVGGEWVDTPLVDKTSAGIFSFNLSNLNPNTTYEYRSVVKFSNLNIIKYGITSSFKTSPVEIPKVRITNIGLINKIQDKDSIFLYFTSTKPRIKGIAYHNTTVKFVINNQSFTTQADSEGKFDISLTLPRGKNTIEYFAYDAYDDYSPTRSLILVIGSENFPEWLLVDSGLITPEPEVKDEPEQSNKPVEKEGVQKPKEEKKPTSSIQLLQFLDKEGNPMVGALVNINNIEYYTDSKGEIQVVGLKNEKKYKVKIEYEGVKYETEVLGASDSQESMVVNITDEDISKGVDLKRILIFSGIGFVILLSVIILFKKARKGKQSNML